MAFDPTRRWIQEMPLWVSRKDADGFITQFTVPMWMFQLIGVLVVVNFLLWATIGIVAAVGIVLGAL